MQVQSILLKGSDAYTSETFPSHPLLSSKFMLDPRGQIILKHTKI